MITKSTGYQSSDKQFHATLEDAQKHELFNVVVDCLRQSEVTIDDVKAKNVAARLMDHRATLVDILSTTATSRPKARKINGATRKRKPAQTVPPVTGASA